MYNLIIADDEEIIRTGLERLVRLMFPEINIRKVCKNGDEVIETISHGFTDILIIDINMPKKSGLDVARYIFEKKLDIHIIMITGYSLFEYAKKAIDYKVDYFFSKPFDSEEIIQSIKTIIGQIDAKNSLIAQKSLDSVKIHSKDKELLLLAHSGVLTSDNIDHQRSFFSDIPLDSLYICRLTFQAPSIKNTDKLKNDLIGFGEFRSESFISHLIELKECEFTFTVISPDNQPSKLSWFINEVENSFRLFYNQNLCYNKVNFTSFAAYLIERKQKRIINSYIQNLQKKKYSFALDELESSLADNTEALNPEFIKSFCDSIEKNIGISADKLSNPRASLTAIRELHRIITVELSKSYDIIENIKAYADENFASNTVSLAEISAELHMNETYLSRLFKEKTGERFVDYLINVRMENAKVLLRSGKYTVTEVSKAVGYNQIKYFRTLFKKKTGITASEYIKRSVVGGHDI